MQRVPDRGVGLKEKQLATGKVKRAEGEVIALQVIIGFSLSLLYRATR